MNDVDLQKDPHPILGPNRPRIPRIIYRPELTPPVQRSILALITIIGWAIWFYLLEPLLVLLAWMAGYERARIYLLDTPFKTLATIEIYCLIIVASALVFISWAIYNWLRFRGMDRRKAPKPVGIEDIAEDMKIEPMQIAQARREKNLTFTYDEDGNITSIVTNPLHTPTAAELKADTPQE